MGLRHRYLRIRICDDEIECDRQFLIFLGVTKKGFVLFPSFQVSMASLNGPPKFKPFPFVWFQSIGCVGPTTSHN